MAALPVMQPAITFKVTRDAAGAASSRFLGSSAGVTFGMLRRICPSALRNLARRVRLRRAPRGGPDLLRLEDPCGPPRPRPTTSPLARQTQNDSLAALVEAPDYPTVVVIKKDLEVVAWPPGGQAGKFTQDAAHLVLREGRQNARRGERALVHEVEAGIAMTIGDFWLLALEHVASEMPRRAKYYESVDHESRKLPAVCVLLFVALSRQTWPTEATMSIRTTIFRQADGTDLAAFAGCNAVRPQFGEVDCVTVFILDEDESGAPVLVVVRDLGADGVLELHRRVKGPVEAELPARSLVGHVVHEHRDLMNAALALGFFVVSRPGRASTEAR
ncbi:MAG: hypothetical protein HYS27_02430 [Deltaproteobacteria bacterium]|nr:hypothetical protein [Deltaproteobacteria bacterium]